MALELTKGFGLTIAMAGYGIEHHNEGSRGTRFAEFTYATSRNRGQYWLSNGGSTHCPFIQVTDWAGEWQLLRPVPIYIYIYLWMRFSVSVSVLVELTPIGNGTYSQEFLHECLAGPCLWSKKDSHYMRFLRRL